MENGTVDSYCMWRACQPVPEWYKGVCVPMLEKFNCLLATRRVAKRSRKDVFTVKCILQSKITGKMKTDSRGKIYLSCLYQMYSTSLANMEFSRR